MIGYSSPRLFNMRKASLRAAGIFFRSRVITTDKNFRTYLIIML